MLVDEKHATSLPPTIFKYAWVATWVGALAILVVGLLSGLGIIKQPISQYISMVSVILFLGGAGLIGVEGRLCTLRLYIIFMVAFIVMCLFLVIDVPYLTQTARLLFRFLFRRWGPN